MAPAGATTYSHRAKTLRVKARGYVSHRTLNLIRGEFVWHHHEHEDELFLVLRGRLLIKFRDKDVWLNEGEMIVIPAKVEHMPVAKEEVCVLLFEPKATLNTGNVLNTKTKHNL